MRIKPHQNEPLDATGAIVADGVYGLGVAGGITEGLTEIVPPVATTRLVPLTTTVGGVPDFVWDENDELIWTEIPL